MMLAAQALLAMGRELCRCWLWHLFGPPKFSWETQVPSVMLMMLALLGKCRGHDTDLGGDAAGNAVGNCADAGSDLLPSQFLWEVQGQ